MKLREEIKNPEPRNLSEVLKECHDLVADLRVKLKSKVDQVLDLRKEPYFWTISLKFLDDCSRIIFQHKSS